MPVNAVYVCSSRSTVFVRRSHELLSMHDIIVNFDICKYTVQKTDELQKSIDEGWQERITTNDRLFDGSKFRFAGFAKSNGKIQLNLGLTSYKDLCGTNLSTRIEELMRDGELNYGDKYHFVSQPLGVGILLITSDDHIVLIKRASWTGEASGCWDRPGGHAEPESVQELRDVLTIGTETVNKHLKSSSTSSEKNVNQGILKEVWGSIIKEAADEVAVQVHPSEVYLMGMSYKSDDGDRPSLEFIARVKQSSKDVRKMYAIGTHNEAEESTALCLLEKRETNALLTLLRAKYNITTVSKVSEENISQLSPGKSFQRTVVTSSCSEYIDEIASNCAPALLASLLLAEHYL